MGYSIHNLLKEKNAQFFVMYANSKNANFYYATNFKISENAFYMIGEDGTELLVISDMEKRRAERESKVKEIASLSDINFYENLKEYGEPEIALTETYIRLLKTHKAKKILIPPEFPSFLVLRFIKEFEVEVVKNPFSEMRKIKKGYEIEEIKKTSKAIIDAFKFLLRLLEKEKDVKRLRREVESFLFQRGYLAEGTIISSGIRTSDPHFIGDGIIEEHVIIDIFPKSIESGYYSDFTRTIILKDRNDIVEMLNVCIEAKREAVNIIKDGALTSEVYNRVCDIIESYGYKTLREKAREGFIHSAGHGIGLEIHEEPRIFNKDEQLKKGMVITIEPGLYYEKIGGVRVEDTILVKRSGNEILTKFDDFVKIS